MYAIRSYYVLADLPGYGYAVASRNRQNEWNQMVLDYLLTRQSLKRVFLLIDARRGIKEVDRDTMRNNFV